MSDQPQTINVTPVAISPVQLKPVADILLVVPDRNSKINYIIGKRNKGTPEVPAVPGVVGRGAILDANNKVISPAIEGRPEVPAVPAILDTVTTVDSGTIEMSDDEWNDWKSQDDTSYRSAIVAKRLGLTLL